MIKNVEDRIVLEFGTGDIGFNSGTLKEDDERVGVIVFYNQTPRQIGMEGDIKSGETVDIRDHPVTMKFYRKESIDEVIKALQYINMEEGVR